MWPRNRQTVRKRQPFGSQQGHMAELNLPTKSEPLAIETLITSRCRDLGLNNARLVRLAGYQERG